MNRLKTYFDFTKAEKRRKANFKLLKKRKHFRQFQKTSILKAFTIFRRVFSKGMISLVNEQKFGITHNAPPSL